MTKYHTESGMEVNRMRYALGNILKGMGRNDKNLKDILAANVQALMEARYGRENLNRLAREAKIGPGSATRIKQAETSVGLDVLEKVAKHFGVEPWQLLMPGLDDDKFIAVLSAWQQTDGRGKRMLLRAAEGAKEDDLTTEQDQSVSKAIRR